MWTFDIAERGRKRLESASCMRIKEWDDSIQKKRVVCQSDTIDLGTGAVAGTKTKCKVLPRLVLPGSVRPSPAALSEVPRTLLPFWTVLHWELWEYPPVSAGVLHRSGRGKGQWARSKPAWLCGELFWSSPSPWSLAGSAGNARSTHAGEPKNNYVTWTMEKLFLFALNTLKWKWRDLPVTWVVPEGLRCVVLLQDEGSHSQTLFWAGLLVHVPDCLGLPFSTVTFKVPNVNASTLEHFGEKKPGQSWGWHLCEWTCLFGKSKINFQAVEL